MVVNGGRGILATSMANRRSGYAEMRNLLLSRRSQELLVVVGCRWPFVSAAVMRVARPAMEFVYGVMGGRDQGLRDYKSRADSSGRKVIWGPLPVGLTYAHARELNDGADSRAPPARMLRLACAGCLCGAMGMQLCSDRRSQPAQHSPGLGCMNMCIHVYEGKPRCALSSYVYIACRCHGLFLHCASTCCIDRPGSVWHNAAPTQPT